MNPERIGGKVAIPVAPEGVASEDAAGRSRREWWLVAALLAGIFVVFQLHLRSVIISDMDEGTYVYAGQLIGLGLVPYRDFLLAHPPLIALFSAACFELFGPDLMAVRVLYIALVVAATLPLYLLARRLTGSWPTALLAVVTYTSGMLLIANMGRTVRLEPLMNAFLIAAVACRFLRADRAPWMALMGALFGCALFVKAVALIPLGMLGLGDLLWGGPFRTWLRRWLWAGAGAALILIPALGWCLSQPNFVRDVLLGQLERPAIGLAAKLSYLLQNVKRYPPVLVGLVAALVILVKARDARLRILALTAFGSTLTLVLAFKTFFAYYIVQSLPWIAFMFAVAVHALAKRWFPVRGAALTVALVLVMGLAAPAAYAVVYERHGNMHVAGPQRILPLLERDRGTLYSMYPAFGLWTGRRMSPWYYEADSLVPRINGWVKDGDFVRVFSASDALVLYTGELDEYPQASAFVKRHFYEAYRDEYWLVWLRAKPR